MDRLKASEEQTLIIGLHRGDTRLSADTGLLLAAHRESVLLGEPKHDQFERIFVQQFDTGTEAHGYLQKRGPPRVGDYFLHATVLPSFAGVPTLAESEISESECDLGPLRTADDVPFLADPNAHKPAWKALLDEPDIDMYAFNLLRIPDTDAYKSYSSHFSTLPERYGMRAAAFGSMAGREAVLAGDRDAEMADNTLFVLAFFPSSRCFLQAWSDPELVREAYPKRVPMLEGGFRHVWMRAHELSAKTSRTPFT